MKKKLYNPNNGLSWSEITDIVNDELENLRQLTIEVLTHHHESVIPELEEAKKAYEKLKSDHEFSIGNVCACLNKANKMGIKDILIVNDDKVLELRHIPGTHKERIFHDIREVNKWK